MTERDRMLPLRVQVAAFCVFFLLVDLLSIAARHSSDSLAGGAVARAFGWERRQGTTAPLVRVVIAHTESGPLMTVADGMLPESACNAPLSTLMVFPSNSSHGYWAPTRRKRPRILYEDRAAGSASPDGLPDELREPIRQFIKTTYAPWHVSLYELALSSDGPDTPIMTGYAHNTVSALFGFTAIGSLVSLLIDRFRDRP